MRRALYALAVFLMMSSTLQAETFIYISDSRDQAIKIYRVNEDGSLHARMNVNVGGAPGSLAIDPHHKFLFTSIRSTTSLASFEIDKGSGQLQKINSVPLTEGANAAFVGTDRSGKYLAAASYSGGKVTLHGIGPDGRLSENPLQTVETTKTAHAAVFDLSSRLMFVPHVAPNAVYQFRFDMASGKLTELGKAPGGAENAGPRHIAIHPQGKFAFTSNETGSSVTVYSLNAEGLRPLQTVSTLPADFSERNTTADVKVHPTGKFVWVSNRGHDSLAGFAFDESSGKVQPLGQTPTEKTPRSFDIDPSGRYLYAGGEGSGKLAAYLINAENGQLTKFQTYDVGTSLSWVLVVSF